MRITHWLAAAAAVCVLLLTQSSHAAPFFFTGAVDDDFFNEANWNDQADGTGASLAAQGDLLQDDTGNAIGVDLVIDGDTVNADGHVDFGTGSLTINNSGVLNIIDSTGGTGHDFDLNAGASLTIDNATLDVLDRTELEGTVIGVNATINSIDDVDFEGDITLTGGTVSATDNDDGDIIFSQDSGSAVLSLAINGTTFSGQDTVQFEAFSGTISGATFETGNDLGIEEATVVVTLVDATLDIGDDINDTDGSDAGALVLQGASTILTNVDDLTESVDVVLEGSSSAIIDDLTGGSTLVLDDSATATIGDSNTNPPLLGGSTATLNSVDAVLTLENIDASLFDDDNPDPRDFIIDGRTGLTYNQNPSAFLSPAPVFDGATLDVFQLAPVPEPHAAALLLIGFATVGFGPRRKIA